VKPGVADVETRVVTAKVEAIDLQKRTVTLRGLQGNAVTLKVDEQVKKFDQVMAKIVTLLAFVGTLGVAMEASAQTVNHRLGTPPFVRDGLT
jgi:hypothetical protein